jgi:RNA polymerase sporulation-specific sigma factor
MGKPAIKTKGLTHEETMELIAEARNGDEAAYTRIIKGHEGIIKGIVKKFMYRGHDFDDLFQVARMGLMKVIDRFDDSYGVKFTTFAQPTIKGELQRYLRDNGPLRVPRGIKELATKIRVRDLVEAPIEDILEAIEDVTEEQVTVALEYIMSSIKSTETVLHDSSEGSAVTLGDMLSGDVNSEHWFDMIAIKEALDHLDDRERTIVTQRYFYNRKQTEIADDLGISQMHVSRLERRALDNLRNLYQSEEEENMPHVAKGNREEAVRLLKETEMTNKEIHVATGVPLGSMGHLSKEHRTPEVIERVKKKAKDRSKAALQKVNDERRKARKTEGKVVKSDNIRMTTAGTETKIPDTVTPVLDSTVAFETTAAPILEAIVDKKTFESGSAVVEFNFNLCMSGVAVDKQEVLTRMEEATNLLKFVNTDKVSFRFNVGT